MPALTNDKDGRMDPRAQLEQRDFHDGDKKDPQCFSLANELKTHILADQMSVEEKPQ